MKCHMNLNMKDWFEIMWINGDHCKLLGRKIYYSNPYYDFLRNLYFKDKVAVPPKCFIEMKKNSTTSIGRGSSIEHITSNGGNNYD